MSECRFQELEGWKTFDRLMGLQAPWYTRPFLKELVKWDVSNWKVFEYGAGKSTLWWRQVSRRVEAVDSNEEWATLAGAYFTKNKQEFISFPTKLVGDEKFDCIIIDGEPWRDECTDYALRCLKPGGVLVIDNWHQDTVGFDWTQTDILLQPYEKHVFKEPLHQDWKTMYCVV